MKSASVFLVAALLAGGFFLLGAFGPAQVGRDGVRTRLDAKQAAGKPWVVHVLVPLCDNEHQGIVPVNSSLGDGRNLRTNLYWGAGYGVRTHFRRQSDWQEVPVKAAGSPAVLERVAFRKRYDKGPEVVLVADAYDGSRMTDCLGDFFGYLAGADSVLLAGLPAIGSGADLVVFNGHNGLMDESVALPGSCDGVQRDAVVIACASHSYFAPKLSRLGAYPYLTTRNLLAPEAYVLRAVVDAWAKGKEGEAVPSAAGAAYHAYQKCGLKGATRLFQHGWGN